MDPSAEFLTHRASTPKPATASTDAAASAESDNASAASAAGDAAPGGAAGLDADIANVMAGLGSFWGKMKKQTATTLASAEKQLDSARKDFTPLVSKARANLDSFGEQTRAELARLSEVSQAGGNKGGVIIGADGMPIVLDDVPEVKVKSDNGKGKGVDRGPEGETTSEGAKDGERSAAEPTPAEQAAAFFTKFQHHIAANPDIHKLTENLTHLQASVQTGLATQSGALQKNIAQLQDQLAHLDLVEQQKKASGLISKGEGWIAELSHEVQRMAKDAIQVVPPGEAALREERGRKRDERQRKAEQVAVGRRDQLLYKLRTDPTLILSDPAQLAEGAQDVRELFAKFLSSIEDRGGLEGEAWASEVAAEIESAGEGLKKTLDELVPGKLTREAFWSRYFFRAGQIDEDEKRRKQLLEGTTASAAAEDDFSWDAEDEDDDEPAAPALRESITPRPAEALPTEEHGASSMSSPVVLDSTKVASPRNSSDGTASSYDVVGRASGAPSEGDVAEVTEHKPALVAEKAQTKEPIKVEESEEDSDWE